MKIAVFGYYNALNAGDDRMQFAITSLLKGSQHEIFFLPHRIEPPIQLLKKMDWILIGGGGLVFDHHGIWYKMKKWMRKTPAKIGVLGLGINNLTEHLKAEVDDLIERSEFFFVRDRRSHQLTGQHESVTVGPDLTWIVPVSVPDDITVNEQYKFAISLAPCHWKVFEPAQWMKSLTLSECVPFPLFCIESSDLSLLSQFFPNVPSHYSLLPLIASRTLIGARFHAIQFAMQLGKPFIAINYDFKVLEACKDAGLEEFCLETDEPEQLSETIRNLEQNRESIIAKISNYRETQISKASQLQIQIREIIGI